MDATFSLEMRSAAVVSTQMPDVVSLHREEPTEEQIPIFE
jgi:hypothetical protein